MNHKTGRCNAKPSPHPLRTISCPNPPSMVARAMHDSWFSLTVFLGSTILDFPLLFSLVARFVIFPLLFSCLNLIYPLTLPNLLQCCLSRSVCRRNMENGVKCSFWSKYEGFWYMVSWQCPLEKTWNWSSKESENTLRNCLSICSCAFSACYGVVLPAMLTIFSPFENLPLDFQAKNLSINEISGNESKNTRNMFWASILSKNACNPNEKGLLTLSYDWFSFGKSWLAFWPMAGVRTYYVTLNTPLHQTIQKKSLRHS